MLVKIFNVSGKSAGVKSAIIKLCTLIECATNEALEGVRITLRIQNHFCHHLLFLIWTHKKPKHNPLLLADSLYFVPIYLNRIFCGVDFYGIFSARLPKCFILLGKQDSIGYKPNRHIRKIFAVRAKNLYNLDLASGSPPISCILPINPCVTALKAFISLS